MNNMLIEGTTFLLGEEVNTDINCSSKYLPGKDSEFVSTVAFDKLEPGFAKSVIAHGGGILVAGKNFGINSSREQAIHVLHLMKIKCILAPSFGRQFFELRLAKSAQADCDHHQRIPSLCWCASPNATTRRP